MSQLIQSTCIRRVGCELNFLLRIFLSYNWICQSISVNSCVACDVALSSVISYTYSRKIVILFSDCGRNTIDFVIIIRMYMYLRDKSNLSAVVRVAM